MSTMLLQWLEKLFKRTNASFFVIDYVDALGGGNEKVRSKSLHPKVRKFWERRLDPNILWKWCIV